MMFNLVDIGAILKTQLGQIRYEVAVTYIYRTSAIITCGLYTFYPLFEVQKRFFKRLFS